MYKERLYLCICVRGEQMNKRNTNNSSELYTHESTLNNNRAL